MNKIQYALLIQTQVQHIYKVICMTFYFKHDFLLLFLHASHGTKEIPDCGNLVRPD